MTTPIAPPGFRRPPRPGNRVATVTRMTPESLPQTGPVPLAAVQGTLALDIRSCRGVPVAPELRIMENQEGDGEVHAWAARFAQAVVEVLAGDRPLPQLVRWTSADVYALLGRRLRVLSRVSPATDRMRTVRPQLRSLHVCRPRDSVAEVSIHVRYGHRSRAIAARLERGEGRWSCTALEFG